MPGRLSLSRLLAVGALVAALSGAAYAALANNTVGSSNAGEGTGTISGYCINVGKYTLDSSNPPNIQSFVLDFPSSPAGGCTQGTTEPTTVVAQFMKDANTTDGGLYSCAATTAASGDEWTFNCTGNGGTLATVAGANSVNVTATQ
jgi:hypothetical protein